MRDDASPSVEQLQAELAELRRLHAAEVAALREELDNGTSERDAALEQQTATSDILRVIASSPTDLDRVLTTMAESAARLCAADGVVIFGVAGESYLPLSRVGPMSGPPLRTTNPIDRRSIQGRAIVDGAPVHVPDVEAVQDKEFPLSAPISRRNGTRSALAVPLLREGAVNGVIYARRSEHRSFTDEQIALLETFADQAVIAIENARLFEELEQRNRDLADALEQQTATGKILETIASSPTNLDA